MKKQFLGLFMTTAILGTTGVTTLVQAEEKSPTEVTTKADVEFKSNDTGTTPPTDPGKPGEPITPPEGGGESGGEGPLRIDWASNFDFGSNEISNTGGDLKLPVLRKAVIKENEETGEKVEDYSLVHFFQVSDLRGEDKPEWSLSVSGTELIKKVEEGTKTDSSKITGARIEYTQAPVLAIGESKEASREGEAKPEWRSSKIELNNQPQVLATAQNDGARGTWSMGMSTNGKTGTNEENQKIDNDINLVIPQSEVGKIRKGKYTAQLNWKLSSDFTAANAKFMAPTAK